MNSVAPSRRLSSFNSSAQLRRYLKSRYPAAIALHRRPRADPSAAPAAATPASCSRQYPSCLFQHLPLQPLPLPHRIIRILQSPAPPAATPSPSSSTPRTAPLNSRTSIPIDQPSLTMWCIVSSSTCSSSPSRSSFARSSGPRSRSNRFSASSSRHLRALASSRSSPPSRSHPPPPAPTLPLPRSPAPALRPSARNRVRSTSCRRTISLRLRSSASTSSSPLSRTPLRHVVGRALRLQLIQKPQPLLRIRQRQPLPLPRTRPHPAASTPCSSLLAPASIRSASPATVGASNSVRSGSSTSQRLPHPRHHLRRQQRMPSQLEKVLLHPHPLHASAPPPRSRQHLFHPPSAAPHTLLSLLLSSPPAPAAPSGPPSRSPSAAAPPARTTRRRHHVLRQPPLQIPPQLSHSTRFLLLASPAFTPHTPPAASLLPRSSRATTTACSTPSCSRSTASISPNSIRYPRIFTCWSIRPRNSSSPSPRHRTTISRPVQPSLLLSR